MDIDDLFAETAVVSTAAVARFSGISETNARDWAVELDVSKVGASFAWVREDVEKLLECLDSEEEEANAEEDEPDEDEDDDEETEDEGDDDEDAA